MFSDPVVGENFFGRQEIIDLLIKRADGLKSGYRQNVAIIGHQQLGKTSILRQFLHLYRDPQVLAIYVEIKLQALDYFVDQFIRSLLFQTIAGTQEINSTDSLEILAQKASPLVPKTVAKIHEIISHLKHRRAEEAYNQLFGLTSILKEETGKNCIVILDEFHRLGEFGVRNAFSDFGKRIMLQKDTMYLLASSAFSASRKILAEKLALLFGNFERVYLEVFDFETSRQLIQQKLHPIQISDELGEFVISLADGHPFFLETMTSRLREISAAKTETAVSDDSITEMLHKLLYESQGVLSQYFMKLISPWTQSNSRGTQLLILAQMAGGRNRLKDISVALNRSQREINRDLKDLLDKELITKSGVFFRFQTKLFKFWLKEIYVKKELSLLGMSDTVEEFRVSILKTIHEYKELQKMEVSERILGLFEQFKNDIVEFGEKKRKLPHFTEFISLQNADLFNQDSKKTRDLLAKGSGHCWLCKISKDCVTEKEILALIATSSKRKERAQTPVLVALKGMDGNAKLLAKEKKILTFNLSKINFLMDLYDKSPIIHTRS